MWRERGLLWWIFWGGGGLGSFLWVGVVEVWCGCFWGSAWFSLRSWFESFVKGEVLTKGV